MFHPIYRTIRNLTFVIVYENFSQRKSSFRGGPQQLVATAFTLVEMLVSIAVLSILAIILTEMITTATITITHSVHYMDADSEARFVLDRMAADFSAMVRGPQGQFLYLPGNQTATKSDEFYFYSQAPGYYSSAATTNQDTVSLVGYRIGTSASDSQPRLERLGKGLDWYDSTANTSVFLTYPSVPPVTNSILGISPVSTSLLENNWAQTISATRDTELSYHVLGESIFRIQICFLMNTPVSTTTAGGTPAITYYELPPTGDPTLSQPSLQNVAGIVVAIAVLDPGSRLLVPSTPGLPQAAGQLASVTASDLSSTPPLLMGSLWTQTITSPSFASAAHIPQRTAAAIRIYQRVFYLNSIQQ